jgi:hypothetical protein
MGGEDRFGMIVNLRIEKEIFTTPPQTTDLQ